MIWIYTIILAVMGFILLKNTDKFFTKERYILGSLGIIISALLVILSITSLVASVSWTFDMANLEVEKLNAMEKRTMYVQLLEDYNENLMPKDYTASDSYYKLYKNIHKFNSVVRKAEKWEGCWWLSGILYNPIYTNIEPIPIN